MKLKRYELEFIIMAAGLFDAVYDFQNNPGKEFKKRYGITKANAVELTGSLAQKCRLEADKMKQKSDVLRLRKLIK